MTEFINIGGHLIDPNDLDEMVAASNVKFTMEVKAVTDLMVGYAEAKDIPRWLGCFLYMAHRLDELSPTALALLNKQLGITGKGDPAMQEFITEMFETIHDELAARGIVMEEG